MLNGAPKGAVVVCGSLWLLCGSFGASLEFLWGLFPYRLPTRCSAAPQPNLNGTRKSGAHHLVNAALFRLL